MPNLLKKCLLYILLFLHQTTTHTRCGHSDFGCISYYSYIKPQHTIIKYELVTVVYLTIPTSNHNEYRDNPYRLSLYILLFLHQTTTYNGDIADNQHVTINSINKK